MASAAEQLAANINFGAFGKATELKKRIWFTLAALVVYRLGTFIPIPGIDPQVMADIFRQNAGGKGTPVDDLRRHKPYSVKTTVLPPLRITRPSRW